jgi:hypothetical protein
VAIFYGTMSGVCTVAIIAGSRWTWTSWRRRRAQKRLEEQQPLVAWL